MAYLIHEQYTYSLQCGSTLAKMYADQEISLWHLNRPIDMDMVDKLYKIHLAGSSIFMPASITICKFGDKLLIVDGQHRIAVLSRIYSENAAECDKIVIMVCTVECKTQEQVKQCFCNINSGTPVPPSYIDDIVSSTIKLYIKFLVTKFPNFVSTANKPPRPYFSAAIVHTQMSSFTGIKEGILAGKITAQDLFKQTLVVNENRSSMYKKVDTDALKYTYDISEHMMKIVQTRGEFYCGLNKNWIDEVACGINLSLSII